MLFEFQLFSVPYCQCCRCVCTEQTLIEYRAARREMMEHQSSIQTRVSTWCHGGACTVLHVLYVCLHISRMTRPNFTKFSVHVICERGSVLLWQ